MPTQQFFGQVYWLTHNGGEKDDAVLASLPLLHVVSSIRIPWEQTLDYVGYLE